MSHFHSALHSSAELTIEERIDAPRTLAEVAHRWAISKPDATAYTFLVDGATQEARLTYGELDHRARAIAGRLSEFVTSGDRALLIYPPGLDFIAAFFGCMYAGVVAVPVNPPGSRKHGGRVRRVALDASASLLLSSSTILGKVEAALVDDTALDTFRTLATDTVDLSVTDRWRGLPAQADALAFLQYTSGATGTPKGVMVTHANILANEAAIRAGSEPSADTVYVSWLPLFHDMGLIGGVLQPLYLGVPAVLMSPTHFLQDPMSWLRAISRFRGTKSVAPNFAFDLCSSAARPERLATLDLSSWRVAWNGAEPIRWETLERFTNVFGPVGFRPETHYPCYGLAEGTLLVSGGAKSAPPLVLELDAEALEQGQVKPPAIADGKVCRRVACGRPLGARVVVVEPVTRRACLPDQIGEIWISGPSVARGYWNRPEVTAEAFGAFVADTGEGPFFRTGDLGFLHEGELVITGRLKDMMIVRGRNIYPQDVEQTIEEAIPFVRTNTCAVFSVDDDGHETIAAVVQADRSFARTLVAAVEADRAQERAAVDQVINSMCRAVAEQFEVTLERIAFVKPGTFPRTSSGKVQRAACKAGLAKGELAVLRLWTATSTSAHSMPPPAALDCSKGSTQERLHAVIVRFLREQLGQVVERVDLETPFAALGIDSMAGVRLLRAIEDATGCHLSPQAMYDFPSIVDLAQYIDSPAAARRAPGSRPTPYTQPPPAESPPSALSAAPASDRAMLLERYVVRSRRIEKLRAAGHYFYGTPVSEQSGARVVTEGREMLMLGSYSYLGLVRHPDIEATARLAIERFGTGHHGVRVLAGTTVLHRELEQRLAGLLLAEDAIVYGSGFTTNVATITALVGEGDCVIGDAWNHASIVDGCRFYGADFRVYDHADMAGLERHLREARGQHTLVVVDSVFSMDGDVAPLPSIVELCRRYGALLMVDEAHSLGVLGAAGRGIQEHFGLPPDAVDVKMATLSKAIPSSGGVVAGRRTIVDYLRHNARGYVFSGALPTVNAAAALDVIEREPERLRNLWRNVDRYVTGLRSLGFDVAGTTTPIVPILCPDEQGAMEMTRLCRADGVFVVPVTYPAVPMNAPRLRTCVSAAHTEADIQLALDVLARAGRSVGLIR